MKPGMLSALNRNLCVPLRVDDRFTVVNHRSAPLLQKVAPCDDRPLILTLNRAQSQDRPETARGWRWFRKALLYAGLLAFLAAANLCVLGFERVAHARERNRLGRQIAEREQRSQRLLEANRHITGVMMVQNAMLRRAGTEASQWANHRPAVPTSRAMASTARDSRPVTGVIAAPEPAGPSTRPVGLLARAVPSASSPIDRVPRVAGSRNSVSTGG